MRRNVNNIITTGHIINPKVLGVKVALLGLGLMMVYTLAKGAWDLRKGFDRITQAKGQYETELARNESLAQKFAQVQGDEYLEAVAREKLNMQKEGEVVVLLPKSEKNEAKQPRVETKELKIYEKWLKLLW